MPQPNKIRLQELANKYLKGNISAAEQDEFDTWFNTEDQEEINIPVAFAGSKEEHAKLLLTKINARIIETEKRSRFVTPWLKIAAAAVVVLFISLGAYGLLNKRVRYQIALNKLHNVGPGGNKAILTLANGKQIILNNAQNGVIANQGNSSISKTGNGQIIYKAQPAVEGPVAYNTISTPNGGQFQVVLPDGTKVWLNSASSLKYPTAFAGKERDVTLTGEAYFEVAKNKYMPFKVQSAGQTVEVLGTHFNINAYADEPVIKTTLLEGSVKVTTGDGRLPALLHPGQQSVLSHDRPEIMVSDADTAQAVAWKNGLFDFKDADVASIMRSLGR
jgi:transmembrane sensor